MVVGLPLSHGWYQVYHEHIKIHCIVPTFPLWHTSYLPSKIFITKIIYVFIQSSITGSYCLANVWWISYNLETYKLSVCLTTLATLCDLGSDLPKFSNCRSCVWMLSWTSSSDNRAVAISSNCGPLWSKEKQTEHVYWIPTGKLKVYWISKSV
jgi:hypothetical protein